MTSPTGRTELADRPWFENHEPIQAMPRGMLGPAEAALLYWLARDRFQGYGEIIDAGAFLGSSSYCLAKGLDENDRIRHKSGRIHAYDLFHIWQEEGTGVEYMADQLNQHFGLAVGDDESTVHIYAANVGDLARHVRVNVGDITKTQWSGRPIEILFVDICKNLPIWKHVLKTFYPSLIPGISIVIHQDYHHPLLPWIHVAQEHLSPYFEIFEPHANDSMALRLVERIPERVLSEAARYDFTVAEELALIDRAIARFGDDAEHIRLAKVVLLARRGLIDAAKRLRDEVSERLAHSTDEAMNRSLTMAASVVGREEALTSSPPAEFDDAAYLDANADVAAAIRGGQFVSGYHHWHAHGRAEGRALR